METGKRRVKVDNGPMLNAYPDSIGGTLADIVEFLENPERNRAFTSFYILPSLFHTDLDRGFSVIDYQLDEMLASEQDLEKLRKLGIQLKLDFILNHASVLSEQFQDILKKGEQSEYRDFFIDWNQFWDGYGTMTEEGYIQPDSEWIKGMFFRKPGLPILMVRFPNGKEVPYWNTFYQEVKYPPIDAQDIMDAAGVQFRTAKYVAESINEKTASGKSLKSVLSEIADGVNVEEKQVVRAIKKLSKEQAKAIIDMAESRRRYLGQMDLNIKSPLVWEFYEETLKKLADYGAGIVRLDAFAYAPKKPGEKNFLNEPGTWELLEKVRELADKFGLELLPEIHASYADGIYEKSAEKGYMTYDFFLPGLIIDALESANGDYLKKWAEELMEKRIRTVNMLGCHDGIPLLDLKGLLSEERIQSLIDTIVSRGGYVKDLHGQKNIYYQVNATYYSALGEDERKMLMARAIQLFMPGKPQIWYLDLFAGKNDYEAVRRAGVGGHKEINRTNLTKEYVEKHFLDKVVQQQLKLLRFRTEFPAFSYDSSLIVEAWKHEIHFMWKKENYTAELYADLQKMTYHIIGKINGEITNEL